MKRKIKKKLFLAILSLVFAICNITAANVNVTASVTPGLTISISAEPSASNLVLTTSTTIKIATVTETTNIKAFTVSMLSINGGSLVGNSVGATLSYTLEYYDTGTTPGTPTPITLTNVYQVVFLANSKTNRLGDAKDLVISYTIIQGGLPADTYEDTIYILIEPV